LESRKHGVGAIFRNSELATNVNAVPDGELIIMKDGLPDFQEMLLRAKATNQKEIKKKVMSQPATYVVFDIL
jgi:ATP-dependent DNA ligase